MLVGYCAFDAGGYFPDTTGVVAMGLLVALALRIALVARPFAGLGRAAAIPLAALVLLGAWSLVSIAWSHAPGRAVLEADRVLAYGLALLLAAAAPWRPGRLRRMLKALTLACVTVCAAALASRLLPTVWPSAPNIQQERLSYPLTYWNALALLAAIGLTLCAQLVCARDEPPLVRALAAAGFPILATTALLTFSRGGLAVAALSLVAYAALARPPRLLSAALATLPPAAVALVAAYSADALATPGAAVTGPGARVAAVVAGASLLAALLAWRLPELHLPLRVRIVAAALAAIVLVAGAAPVAVRQLQRFGDRPAATAQGDERQRLTDPSSNGRTEYWRAAWRSFTAAPVGGEGAGTYQLAWWRERRVPAAVTHAHSLYLETLGELGLPGLGLVLVALGAVVAGLARRRDGPDRAAAEALLVAALAWMLHAALDWDWEMPAVTIWLWAVAGAALARPPAERGRPLSLVPRAALAFACMATAALPGLVALGETRLEAATTAYRAGDCALAQASARSADAALGVRAEPLALQGVCAARAGDAAAARQLDRAVARDPDDWELRYDRALAAAAAGADPRADLAAARRLNPLEPAIAAAAADPARAPVFLQGLDEPPIGGPPAS